jgi:bifunctional enzyme CysN/CysC
MRTAAKTVTATVSPLKYKINFAILEHVAATHLDLDEVGVVQLELDEPIAFAPGSDLGRFTLLDPLTHAPVGAGRSVSRCAARTTSICRRSTSSGKLARR